MMHRAFSPWMTRPARAASLTVAALLGLAVLASPPAWPQERVSAFGRYAGYTEPVYDGWSRHAEYAPMLDGVLVAVEYFVPTSAGVEAGEPLPVILVYTRYLRSWEESGRIQTLVEREPFLRELLAHGYLLAVANSRGTGASFGSRQWEFSLQEQADLYEIVEWIAAQGWCDGQVGMWGRSYSGMTGLHAAAEAPPHLRAVFSEMAGPNVYDFIYQGGTYKHDFLKVWSDLVRRMDLGLLAPPAQMDSDSSGAQRDSAVAEHADNLWPHPRAKRAKFRDWSRTRPGGDEWSWDVMNSILSVDDIREAAIPVYHLLGWYDQYATQQALMYENLRPVVPQKMTIGPWTHSRGFGDDVHRAEALRWFDYWLKGIDNGVMRDKPVHYYLMRGNHTLPEDPVQFESRDEIDAEDSRLWKATGKWPPKKAKGRNYYLAGGDSGTVASVNDGRLTRTKPGNAGGADSYRVDLSSVVGSYSRWMDGYGERRADRPGTTFFDERTAEDEKVLTYTSEPMSSNQAIVGYPVVHLWVSSTKRDGDFFVYLEEIDAEGRAHYVTEGMLRASHRALAEAPWRNFGLPFHPSTRASRANLPAEPVELVFDLMGTAIVIDRGHRIRISVAGADYLNHARYPTRNPAKAPEITLYRNATQASYVELPMMRAR